MTTTKTLSRLISVAVLAVFLVPQAASAAQQVITPLPTLANLPAMVEYDPTENLPTYSYQQTGTALAVASPRTVAGNWPTPTQKSTPKAALKLLTPPLLTTANGSILVLEGEASYYSRAGCLGCDPAMIMANGQSLDDSAYTMAIGANLKHLVGRHALVTSLATGKSVQVRITDTGGFYQAKYGYRVADLTIATKNAIGMAGGVGQVRVEVF